MKNKYMIVVGALTVCGSLLVTVPSSFAAKSMNDQDMDQTSAGGQSRIDIGDGDQYIGDGSIYQVSVEGQQNDVGGSIINLAGENNVAVGLNVANSDAGQVLQYNNVSQQRNGQVVIYGTAGVTVIPGSAADGSSGAGVATTAATGPGLVIDATFQATLGNALATADGMSDLSTIQGGDITIDNINASADHIKIGTGNQTEVDSSVWTVEIGSGTGDTAQNNVTALSMVNAAGRNNVAVGLNAANSDQAINTPGFALGITSPTLLTGVTQVNTFVQQN